MREVPGSIPGEAPSLLLILLPSLLVNPFPAINSFPAMRCTTRCCIQLFLCQRHTVFQPCFNSKELSKLTRTRIRPAPQRCCSNKSMAMSDTTSSTMQSTPTARQSSIKSHWATANRHRWPCWRVHSIVNSPGLRRERVWIGSVARRAVCRVAIA